MPSLAKTRSDSTIDSRLDPDQAEIFFERLENGLSLREGVAWLLAEHRITLSEMSLSRWAAKRRRAQADAAFASALETIRADRERAAALLERAPSDRPLDAAAELAQASLLLANHALFAAQRDGDPALIAQATRTVTGLQSSQAQKQRAQTSRVAAERTHRRQAFAAVKVVIEYERSKYLTPPGNADAELRDALFLFINRSDWAAVETTTHTPANS